MRDHEREDLLGKVIPPPRSRFGRWARRISEIGIGPVPVGSLFLLAVLYLLPLVVVWNLIDYLPRWVDKVVMIGGAIVIWALHNYDSQRENRVAGREAED